MIGYEKQDHIVTITIDRPERRNAVGRVAMSELMQAWQRFRADPDARVSILTGAGDVSFCAGADLKEMAANPTEPAATGFWAERGRYGGTGHALEDGFPLWKPVIAAINGHCIGEGVVMSLGADIRLCSANATFALTEVKRGINTIVGAIRLPQVVGPSMAAYLALTGDSIDAGEALRCGLVTAVLDSPAELRTAARELAGRIAANAPLAVQAVKEILVRGQTAPFDAALAAGGMLRQLLLTTDDHREGLAAFNEKRSPMFHGR
jgi:(E)-benzylidenesuccinyl-CoA hydratase